MVQASGNRPFKCKRSWEGKKKNGEGRFARAPSLSRPNIGAPRIKKSWTWGCGIIGAIEYSRHLTNKKCGKAAFYQAASARVQSGNSGFFLPFPISRAFLPAPSPSLAVLLHELGTPLVPIVLNPPLLKTAPYILVDSSPAHC
jgi:hypothetical protein